MLPFGMTNLATVPQRSEIPEGLMNYPVLSNTNKKMWKQRRLNFLLKYRHDRIHNTKF
jgi:hypothetical protein